MSELSVGDRARRGDYALRVYGLSVAPTLSNDAGLACELITDIMHALEVAGFDAPVTVDSAIMAFYSERTSMTGQD